MISESRPYTLEKKVQFSLMCRFYSEEVTLWAEIVLGFRCTVSLRYCTSSGSTVIQEGIKSTDPGNSYRIKFSNALEEEKFHMHNRHPKWLNIIYFFMLKCTEFF